MYAIETDELSVSRNRAGSFFVFLLLLIAAAQNATAQEESTLTDATSQGKGGTSVATPSVWNTFSNQGALGFYNRKTAAIHQENRFAIRELNVSGAALSLPTRPGTVALAFSRYGYKTYNESRGMLAIGRKFWPTFAAGVGVGFHHIRVGEGYGNATATTVEAGILYTPLKNIAVGLHLFNPTTEKIGTTPGKELPSGITAGFDYTLPQGVLASVSATQQNSNDTEVNLGVEATITKQIKLRAGYSSQPDKLSFGFGYEYKALNFDLAITTNNPLGVSGYVSAAYHIQ